MLSYIASAIASRTDHPFVFSTFIFAAIFLAAGYVVSITTGNGVAAGFFALYAILAAVLGVVGYGALFIARGISMVRQQAGPAA
jgi:hypothetical protein